MSEQSIRNEAFRTYLRQMKRDKDTLYYAHKLVESSFRLPGDVRDEISQRELMKQILVADLYALSTSHGLFNLSDLTLQDVRDIERVAKVDDADARNFLLGQLWHAAGCYRKANKGFMRSAMRYFKRVPDKLRLAAYHEMVSECLAALDYPAFLKHVPDLLNAVAPEWHAHRLIRVYRACEQQEDWLTYLALRKKWDELPINAHVCDCLFNQVATMDGLAAFHRKDYKPIPKLLIKALNVRGCPHLNSGSARLTLVEKLVNAKLYAKETRQYLEKAMTFHSSQKAKKLLSQLDSTP